MWWKQLAGLHLSTPACLSSSLSRTTAPSRSSARWLKSSRSVLIFSPLQLLFFQISLECHKCLVATDSSWNISTLSSSQHPFLPGDFFVAGKRGLWFAESSVPLVCWCHHRLVYLKCCVLMKALFLFSSPQISSFYLQGRFTLPDSCTFMCLRRCLGNVWWHASFSKATSAMTLTCHLHCSCRGGFSSRIRSSKHTRLRWTYSSRRWSNLSCLKWINLDFIYTTISMAMNHLCVGSTAVRHWQF